MLPVCSATTCCSCHTQIPVHGGLKTLSTYWKTVGVNYTVGSSFSNRVLGGVRSKSRPVSCFFSNCVENRELCGSTSMSNWSLYRDGVVDIRELTHTVYQVELMDESHQSGATDLIFANSLFGQETNFSDIVSKISESTADTISIGKNVLNGSFDSVTSSLTSVLTNANEAVDNAINEIVSFIDKVGDSAGNKLTGFSGELKEASGRAGIVSLDLLRESIVVVENSLVQGAKTVVYVYNSAKELLPPEFQETLNSSEERATEALKPVVTTFQQVYMALEGFEESLGLEPSDPLIPFILFLGVSATLWYSYRVLRYSGYSGDLSPQSALELLRGNENVVLVDIRPENLREKDGIPDLRRTARFRYAGVTVPEVDGSVKKLLKQQREVEDIMLAAVIRNLKMVEDKSKVVIMDADGTRSKRVARSLRKLGTKSTYRVQGGFRSWVNEGFRIKMMKPETALTILNEEAEAILEEINPTPLKLVGYGVGLITGAYSLVEWEKTLQFIGVIGLGQTIYRRVASYQDAEDFKQDLRLLLAPVRLGGQAISWAANKLETNRNGLPTSPSSSDVQSRVLQAAAKHESQPSDSEEVQDSSEMASSGSENINISDI